MEQLILNQITLEEFKSIISETIKSELENLSREIPKPNEDIYGTRKEVANKLHISLPTLNELTKNGILKGYRLQGRVLYKWAEVDGALKEITSLKYKRVH
jgi:excisionase family DNA binding protein